jgi:hypothetical protein
MGFIGVFCNIIVFIFKNGNIFVSYVIRIHFLRMIFIWYISVKACFANE